MSTQCRPGFLRKRPSSLGYAGLAAGTAALGLASRHYAAHLPRWVLLYAGDVLWALLVYWLAGVLRPRWRPARRALAAGAFALAIELSQLWQAPWLVVLRHTRPGALVLGQGFSWLDLACYALGIALGVGTDVIPGSKAVSQAPPRHDGLAARHPLTAPPGGGRRGA